MFFERLPEFIGNHFILVTLFLLVALMLISTEFSALTRRYKAIAPAELTRLVNRDNALLVDVSANAEYEAGHIAGSRHVAMAQLDPEHKDLARVKDLPVIVVCRSGQNSATAAAKLSSAGFTQVHWLDGGLASWTGADLPLAKGKA
ncbi:MAG TPA: rhodanese-like domain-containing protein [Pseudomonadota bacterium]|nr:rhodanese-like domain-containing protein [Pseudomonadota bacterium]